MPVICGTTVDRPILIVLVVLAIIALAAVIVIIVLAVRLHGAKCPKETATVTAAPLASGSNNTNVHPVGDTPGV